jgi:hypothetical protein
METIVLLVVKFGGFGSALVLLARVFKVTKLELHIL